MSLELDNKYMRRALDLAAKGKGKTSPNPMVGAVIVKDGVIVGEGFHERAGLAHAEVNALKQAGEKSRGATMYVILEPCIHYGRTPPCVNQLVEAGLQRVVVSAIDPNPRVSGQGIEALRRAGIKVDVGILESEAKKLNEVFFHYIKTGRPFVSLKVAMTLDGKIATRTGNSRWITGEASRAFVHELRNLYSAVMVSIGTVLKDDPMLNVRLGIQDINHPVRIILDGRLDLPVDGNIAKTGQEYPTIVFTSKIRDRLKADLLIAKGIEVIEIGGEPDRLSVPDVLRILGGMEISSVLVEGGSELNAYMIENGLANKFYWFIAPRVFGGRSAVSPVGGQGVALANEALELEITEIKRFNSDLCLIGYKK
ncbi:MAG: bifunctional diaminohydroxyphosphoribosylaminopyrimidine deaminase/5-amino-6-(5-phosphoribosylamino)uracil reductase RibD [Syntrophomonadaceae bacterium]|jgi:diaminohydroxyphosphoribosylaminopyrimidine deaminase/5-amino-6-(5-phosphoribosylamino)uracil reductase